MSAPHVTIRVKGSPATGDISVATLEDSLHMFYLQAVDGEKRYQWIVFPPAVGALGVSDQEVTASAGRVKVLHRVQEFEGNRSKWFHSVKDDTFLLEALKSSQNKGHAVSKPVVVKLELDDYQAAWQGETPHKAIRAVDRAIKDVLNTSVK